MELQQLCSKTVVSNGSLYEATKCGDGCIPHSTSANKLPKYGVLLAGTSMQADSTSMNLILR